MMKLYRYILLVGVIVLGGSVNGQKSCSSGILTNGSFEFCSGSSLKIYVNNDTANTKYFYQWYTGNYPALTAIANAKNASYYVTSPAKYYIRIIDTLAKDTCYSSQTVTMNAKPTAAFTFTPNAGCGRTPVQFTNSNTLVGSIYNWDFGDNNNNQSSLQNPSHVYIPTGVSSTTYQIMLAVKDVNSKCFDTVRKTITIGAGPDASITGTNPIDFNGKSYFTICAPDLPNFSFTNQTKTASINSSYKIQWGDGSNDTIMSTWTVVTHNYPVGIFNMKVIVTGSNGCTNTGDYYIFYGSNPALGFANPGNTSICSGDSKTFPVTLTANNPPGTIYEVSYNDGSPSEIYTHPPPTSITHTFNTTSCGVNGTTYQNAFWIKMTASNPCGFTPQPVEPIYVSQKPSTDFGISPKDTTCINTTVTLNNSSTFNNNIKVNPSNGTATCTNGNIVWSITPATGWSVTSGSLGNDNSTTNPANWTSGTNILEINFLISGSYTITLKTGGSTICGSSTKIKTICVNPTPTASFTIPKDTLCAGDNLNFTSTSNTPLCGSNLYSWSVVPATTVGCNAAAAPTFVNPTTPSSANPIINFSKPGTYVVSLTTTIQGTGCTSVAFKHTITVKDKPAVTVALSRPTICQGDTVTPIVTATCFATNATYSWIFTNGTPSTSNVKSPGGIAFNTTGNNNISVDVTNSCGTTTQSTSVSVKPSPTLTATATNATICNGQNATLNLNSNQVGIKYTWTSTVTSGAATGNSNQPTAITTTTISNTLTNTGSVDAVVRYTINVVGATGCIGETKTVDITVRPGTTPPNAGLDQNLCNATTATLAGNNPTVGTGTWTKILGGAATITNANLYNTTITGLLPDIYQFVWTIAGSGGGTCPNTPDTMKIINRPTVTTANAGNDIVVCNFSTVNNSVTLQGNAANPNRSFETGTWTVITKPTGSSASFSNINNPTTTFTFNQIGNYTLAWTIANDITCTPTTDTVTIKVYQAAVGGTTSSSATVCKNNNTGTITLTGFTGNIIKWQYKVLGSAVWVDVANTTSSLNYTNLDTTTTYQAIVTTTNTIDCPITAISSQTIITVNPVPVISNLTATSPTQCASNTGSISFNVTPASGNYAITYTLNGGNQTTNISTTNGVITINNLAAGLYDNIKVTLNSCSSNTLGSINLSNPNKPATPVITGNTPICSGGVLNLSAATSSVGTATYNWVFKDGSTPTGATQSISNIAVAQGGVYHVTVTINQCTSNDTTINITVNQTPSAPTTSAVAYCQNTTATALTASGTNLIWYNNIGLTNGSITAPIPITTTVANTTYYVVDSSNAGCKSVSASLVVTINATPVISNLTKIDPQQCQAANGSISFNVTPTTGSYTVAYTKGGVSQPVINNVNPVGGVITINNLNAGSYDNIKVTLNNCPSNTLGAIILSDPNPPATPVIVGVDSICSGKNLVLNPVTLIINGVYTWTHPNSNTTIGNTYTLNNISTQDLGVYKLSVTLNLCKSNDATFTVRVDSTPVAPVLTSNSPKCTDSTIKLFATTTYPMPVTYIWTGANSFTSTQQNPIISPATLLMSGSYNAVVTSVVGKCSSQVGTTNVVVNETPHIVFKDSTYPTQCATATGNIRLSGLKANTAYQITYTVGGNTFNQTQTSDGSGILKIDTLRAGTYSNIFVTLNACPSNTIGSYTLVDPNPPATPVIIGVDSICSGKNLTLTASTTSAGIATYDWTGPNGFIQNGTNGTIIINNIITNATATFTATAIIAKCISTAVSKTVRVDSTPIAPALASNSPVCTDSTIKLFATTAYPMTVTYSWTGVNSFTSTQQNPTISTATLAMAGAYNATVTSVVGKCSSQVGTTNVVVNETPHIVFKDSTYPTQCATATGNIRLSGLKANTAYQITYTVGGNTFNQTQTSDGSGILKIDTLRAGTYSNIFVTLNACPSNAIGSYTLVDPNPPATPVIVGVDSICSQKNLTLNPATIITNGVYTWTHPNGNTTISNTYTLNNISTQDFGVYKLSVTLNLCKSNDATFTVRVDSTPVAPVLTSNSPVCSDSAIKLFATTAYPMPLTYSWTGVSGFTSTQQNPTISNATLVMAGNYAATVTSIVGKCPSQVSTTNIVVNETPNVAQLNDTTYKDGTNSGNIIFTGTVANTTFNWVNSNPTIGLAASSAGTINFNATNTTPFPIFGIVTVTPSTQFCVGKPMNFKITVNPTPTLSSKLKDTICTDNLYTYQATSVTPNVKYTWIRNAVSGISNAASSSTDSSGLISETLINTTTQPIDVVYTFKLYSLGSVNSVPFVLTVNPNAKAVYTFANDKLCTPAFIDSANIKVQDFSNATYEWYANNILIGTGINFPGFSITNNGDTVYIKLKAISTFGCKPDSFEHKFYTVKTPTVLFTKSSTKGCGPLTVSFTNKSTPLNAPTYSWNFGNGQTSNLQTPNDVTFIADTSYNRHDTTYYITLTAYTQCDTIKFVDSVTVLPKPRALFQPDTTVGCSVFHFAAFNNSLGTHNTYTWDFGDSTALVIDTAYGYYYHNFKVTTTDTFNVKLKAENVCGVDSFTVNVVVFPNTIVPKLVVDGTNNFGCAPTNIRFINNTRGANRFTVNFGDGSLPYISTNNPDTIYHYYTTGGNYTATLKAQNSCTDSTVALTITLYNKPAASFSTLSSEYCKNNNIHFTNTSDTTLNCFWNFGDGITSTAIHPNHTYSSAGNYTITLIVKSTNASGAVCTDTATKNIIVHQIPSAAFTTNAVLQNCQPYLFEGVAPIINGYIYNWKFYDASSIDTTKSGAVGTHTFYNTGTYNIRLIVFNSFGCSDTSFANVKVIETPKAAFSLSDSLVCVPGKTINFTNKTTYSAADAINYEWYVDGIKQTTTTNFNYNFTVNPNITTAVTFKVKLIVTNSYGCKDSLVKKVMIQPKAKATFQINAAQGCAPFSLQVNNSSLYANIFKWYVDGNLVSVAASPSPFQLAQPNKNYIIKLVADHTLGCGIDSTVLQFTTYPKPIADFQIPVTSSCSGVLNINCFDLSSVAGGSIKKWNWSFGDGKTDTIQNPSHSYNISGAFSVSLWVKDDKDCVSDIAFITVKNFGKPKANFAVGNVCLGSDAVPVNLSSTGFGSTSITSYLWNFGDGTFLTGNQPIHKYNTEGVYTITLTITADSSCVADTISKKITVYGKPTASFSFGNTCVNQITQFNNLSLFGFGQTSIGNSNWFFGDGLTSNINNPTHIYTASNSYNVKLQVSGNRCPNLIDTITKTIVINQPRNSVVYPRIDGTRGTPIQLNAANNGIAYQWLPSTALDNAFIQNPIANFAISSPNIVNYQIKITDSFGCVATDKQEVWLFAGADIFLPTAFTPNGDNANDLFKPLYINIQKIQYFRVFDRWGKIVFETSDMSKSWDGTLTGKELPTDTYVWTIAGFTNDGTEIIRKGNVTLIRN